MIWHGTRSLIYSTASFTVMVSLCATLAASCSTPRDAKDQMTIPTPSPPIPLPPNTCRLKATIVNVLPVSGTTAGDPCSTAPCLADVRVDSVLGYGSSFPAPLSAGNVIRLRFTFTLAPTKAMFPSMQNIPAALQSGDSFTAVLQAFETVSSAAATERFIVNDYQRTVRKE